MFDSIDSIFANLQISFCKFCLNNASLPESIRLCLEEIEFREVRGKIEKIVYTSRFVRVILAQGPC